MESCRRGVERPRGGRSCLHSETRRSDSRHRDAQTQWYGCGFADLQGIPEDTHSDAHHAQRRRSHPENNLVRGQWLRLEGRCGERSDRGSRRPSTPQDILHLHSL